MQLILPGGRNAAGKIMSRDSHGTRRTKNPQCSDGRFNPFGSGSTGGTSNGLFQHDCSYFYAGVCDECPNRVLHTEDR
jgi:hypothetical protein